MRDSRTGYFIPARYGLGLWPDGKIVGATSSSASPGNHLEKVTLTVLVFGPEWVSYERSRRMRHAKMREISVRVFFVKIPKSQDSVIYTIFSFFRIHIPKIDSFPMLFSHPTRPPVRPSVRPSWITGYQTGACSSISQFTGHKAGSCSSISQFKGC